MYAFIIANKNGFHTYVEYKWNLDSLIQNLKWAFCYNMLYKHKIIKGQLICVR